MKTLYALRTTLYARRRKGRAFCVIALSLLLLSCRTGRIGVGESAEGSRPAGAALEAELQRVARECVRSLPQGSRVAIGRIPTVVGADETRLSLDLANRFGDALVIEANRSGGRCSVKNRELGEDATNAEMRYITRPIDPRKLLREFEADYAVCGTYELRSGSRSLEVRLRAVKTTGADVHFAGCCRAAGDYYEWQRKHEQLLPNLDPGVERFLREEGKWQAVASIRVVKRGGRLVPSPGNVRVGTEVKVRVVTRESGYLYVFGWDQDNRIVTLLYPARGENPFVSKDTIMVPPGQVYVKAVGPPGYNWVKAVMSKKPVESVWTSTGMLKKGETVLKPVIEELTSLGRSDWSSRAVGVTIEE